MIQRDAVPGAKVLSIRFVLFFWGGGAEDAYLVDANLKSQLKSLYCIHHIIKSSCMFKDDICQSYMPHSVKTM